MGALPAACIKQSYRLRGFPGLQFLNQSTRYRFYHGAEEAAAADRFSSLEQCLIVFGFGRMVQQVDVSLSGNIIAMPVLAFQAGHPFYLHGTAANRALKHLLVYRKFLCFFYQFFIVGHSKITLSFD